MKVAAMFENVTRVSSQFPAMSAGVIPRGWNYGSPEDYPCSALVVPLGNSRRFDLKPIDLLSFNILDLFSEVKV